MHDSNSCLKGSSESIKVHIKEFVNLGDYWPAMHHEVFNKFECWQGEVPAGFAVNFLGVITRTSFFTMMGEEADERWVKTELPAFDEEYFEWIDLLEAVTWAQGQFTMIELGAGWGRWLVNAAAAIRHYNDLPYKLIGVEPEPTHFQWMMVHFRDNRLDPHHHELIEAAVADKNGWVRFYTGRPAEWYGQTIAPAPHRWLWRLRKLFTKRESMVGNGVKKVKAVSLETLLRPLDQVDLIDLDVQGAELIALKGVADELHRKVRRVHVGTHGAKIEDGLRMLFRGLGWKNVNDYPSSSESCTPWGAIKFQDGVQSWINPRLC